MTINEINIIIMLTLKCFTCFTYICGYMWEEHYVYILLHLYGNFVKEGHGTIKYIL